MSRIIKQREYLINCNYSLSYVYRTDPGCGFEFDCDKDGNIHSMNPVAQENYNKCKNGVLDVIFQGVQKREWGYWEPGELKCDCGSIVILDCNTNDCDCYRSYNKSGQELAPMIQWGEETGEHYTDCL